MSDLTYLQKYYPDKTKSEIQTLIDAAMKFEEERKRFVLSIPQKEKKKIIKTAVKINGLLVYQN